jgi:hypothetical protein
LKDSFWADVLAEVLFEQAYGLSEQAYQVIMQDNHCL